MGVTIALFLVAGMGLRWLVDRLIDTFPLFVFLGLGLGSGSLRHAVTR